MADLSDRMLARANKDKLPADHPLRMLAAQFNVAADGFYGDPQTVTIKQFMGYWARARRAWSDYSGEPLI